MASESKEGDENAPMGVASAASALTGPNANLLDFWKTLWHVDVHKDHGNTYDAKIVNSFLPDDGKYTTDQELDGYKISVAGQYANRNGGTGKVLGFAELFKYLTKIDFADIQKINGYYVPGTETSSTLEKKLMGENVTYQIKVFDDKGFIGNESKIGEFIGAHKIALFVDTSSHLPELIENYKPNENMVYAYTREIESDPADKTTYLTIGKKNKNKRNFFYELQAPANPTVIAYPPYSPANAQDGMSYFYCKYPVF